MSKLSEELKTRLKGTNKKIVFPEALDERILQAVSQLSDEGVMTPVLIGEDAVVFERAKELGVDLTNCIIIDPNKYPHMDTMVAAFVERRKGKATKEEAEELLLTPNYFGTMLVYMEKADGLVSGAVHATGDTVRPALQIIRTKPGTRRTSGVFLMVKDDTRYVFGDCAINISPESEDLAEIALASAETSKVFGIEPRVAMLSFSTKGSAKSPETEKVIEATKIAQERNPGLVLDGEFQFDTAFVPEVAKQKAPDSEIQGDANVFIFPSLEAGNIGYKLVERLGGFEAVGPILQGLNSPVNDLSRGCDVRDVYKLALITAVQAL